MAIFIILLLPFVVVCGLCFPWNVWKLKIEDILQAQWYYWMHYGAYMKLKKKHSEMKQTKYENWQVERERRKVMGTRYQVRPDAFNDLKTNGSIYAAQVMPC